jgi:hypothetical protein
VGIVHVQLSFVERGLRRQWRNGVVERVLLSVVHAAIGLFVFIAFVTHLNVIVTGRYNQMIFPYEMLIPLGGGLFGLLVPWLPLLWHRQDG